MIKRYSRILLTLTLILSLSITTSFAGITNSNWIYKAGTTTKANIRSIAKQKATGYNVLQGSCNDGNGNFYFAFMKKSTERVKIVKMRFEDGKFTYCNSTLLENFYHGNDLTYIPNVGDIAGNDKILITNNDDGTRTNHIVVFDVATMKVEDEITSKYWKQCSNCKLYIKGKLIEPVEPTISEDISSDSEEENDDEDCVCLEDYVCEHHGFSNLAYNNENGKLVASLCSCHDLMIFNLKYSNGHLSLVPEAYLVQNRKESVIQGIDCDSKYIYMTWSAGNGISGNRLCVYNWVGKNIKNYTIDSSYEIESISHSTIDNSTAFYAGYHHSYVYKWVEKEKKKYKWKKVWNKAHTKKVWKYKTKTIKTNHSEVRRNAYIKKLCVSIP